MEVLVPELTINYLLEEKELAGLKDKDDLLLAEKYINKGVKSQQDSMSEEGDSRTSLMWFTVS
jgi:hypothetical protein